MAPETKVTDSHQTQVPAAVREKHGIEPGDLVVWEETPEGEIRIRFRRRQTLDDVLGAFPDLSGGDAVEAKKRAQRGGR